MTDIPFYSSTFETDHEVGGVEIGQIDLAVPVQLGITVPTMPAIAAAFAPAIGAGDGPHSLGLYDGKLYVTCQNSDNVYVYDGINWALSGTVGDSPLDLAVYEGRLYVACQGSDNVYVFDGTNWALSGAVGDGPLDLAVYNGYLYVACTTSGDVYVFDGSTWEYSGLVGGAGSGPHTMELYGNNLFIACQVTGKTYIFNTFSWDQLSGAIGTTPTDLLVYEGKLYVACQGSDNVYVLNGPTSAFSWQFSGDVGDGPTDLAVYDGKLYVTCQNSDNVYVFDGTNWALSGAVGTTPIDLAVYNDKLYAACQGSDNVYVFDGTNWALSGAVGDGPIDLEVYDAKLYVTCFTSDDVYVFDDTSWTRFGDVGSLTGGYRYKVTYRNHQGFESNGSSASILATMAEEECRLTDIPRSSDPQVVERRIYRTEAGGTTYKLLTTIEDNYSTTYYDNVADSLLGATIETDHDVPEVFSEIHSHKSLLRGVEAAEKNIVWWANAFDGWEYFDVYNYDTFGSTSNESQAIETLSDSMVIVQKHKVWNLNTMEEPEELAQSLASRGVPGPKACWNAGEVLIMVDSSGIFLYDKLTDVAISGPIEPIFDAEGTHVRRINEDYADNLCACTLNDKVLVSYTSVLDAAIVNDTTLIFDKRNGIFQGLVPVGFSDFTVNKTDKIIYGAGTDGIIYKLETGSDDEGTDIDWHFQTKDFTTETGGIGVLKRGNIAKIDCNPNGGTITIDVYLDGVSSQTITVTGDSRTVKRWRLPIDVDFYRVSFKVSGSGQQYIYGIMFTFKELGF